MTKPYTLTPAFFARTRERLAQRKAELVEELERKAKLIEHIQALDEESERLDADEKLAADLAARYEADIAAELPKRRGRPKRPTPSRPVPSGRPWTLEEDAAVLAGDPKNDDALAEQIDRKTPRSIAKRRKILRDRQAEAEMEDAKAPWDTTSPAAEIAPVEPAITAAAAQPADVSQFDGESAELNDRQQQIYKAQTAQAGILEAGLDPNHPDHEKAKRLLPTARVVDGIVDSGPGRPRYYDAAWESR